MLNGVVVEISLPLPDHIPPKVLESRQDVLPYFRRHDFGLFISGGRTILGTGPRFTLTITSPSVTS